MLDFIHLFQTDGIMDVNFIITTMNLLKCVSSCVSMSSRRPRWGPVALVFVVPVTVGRWWEIFCVLIEGAEGSYVLVVHQISIMGNQRLICMRIWMVFLEWSVIGRLFISEPLGKYGAYYSSHGTHTEWWKRG